MKNKIVVSIIIVGRNDDYGGGFRFRLQQCLSNLTDQLFRHKIRSEIVFVNYNPVSNSKIVDFIDWPCSNEYTDIKIITVPLEAHLKFLKSNPVRDDNVLEFPAKNIGIRRAVGEYVLCTNADILFDEPFFEEISVLKKGFYYRADRYDFKLNDKLVDSDNVIAQAKKNITKVWIKAISRDVKRARFTKNNYRSLVFEQKKEILWYNFKRFFNFFWKVELHPKAEFIFHCNASGDFFLMHRDYWFALRGYKESSKLALHVDALFVAQAWTLGLKECILKHPIFHQEHKRRFGDENENVDFENSYIEFQNDAQGMLKNKEPIIYNEKNWGFAGQIFEEIYL